MKREQLKKLLGKRGVSGVRLREAAEPDMLTVRDLLQGKIREVLKLSGDDDPWPYVVALYAENVVVEIDGKLMSYGYTISGQDVALGNPVEVTREFRPIGDTPPPAAPDTAATLAATVVEAVDGSEGSYLVRVIRAGMSGNRNFYSDAVLREAVALFEGVRVFVKSDLEHLREGGKDVRNLIGALSEPVFVEGKLPDSGEIRARLTLIVDGDDPTAIRLREATKKRLTNLFGLSIDANGSARKGANGVRVLEAFTKVNSVDLIVEPGAGGEIISFLEALGEEGKKVMDRDEIIALIQANAPHLLEGKDISALTDDELKALLAEAMKDDETEDNATTLVEAVERRTRMREAVNASKLPAPAKQRLISRFTEAKSFTDAQVTQAIKDEAEYLSSSGLRGGHVLDLGDGGRFIESESRPDKIADMLDAFFDPSHEHHRHARSFKECYIEITGDRHVTGRARDAVRIAEALNSSSFSEVLGDGIHRRMVAEYRSTNEYDYWKFLTGTPVPVTDFRKQERTRIGGYGDMPAVAEGADYQALTSPTDEKAEYAVTKRGGLETITLEMIKNDDVGAIQRIPGKLARAAKRTLAKFVLDFIRTNPTIYDTKALFHADHGNLGSAALAAQSYAAARLAMVQQTEYGATDPIGVGPKYLWLPPGLEETAYNLFQRSTNNDKTFVQSLVPEIIPVWYWTDPTDWAVTADVADIPLIELGFLDGNEEPELFVQDSPTVGSLFTADKVTYKLRHIYGGDVLDYRGAYKSVVADG
jgi:hypothetical protein